MGAVACAKPSNTSQAGAVAAAKPVAEQSRKTTHETMARCEEELWQREHGAEPARLVAEYATRLLNAIVSMSKARTYVLGQVRKVLYANTKLGSLCQWGGGGGLETFRIRVGP